MSDQQDSFLLEHEPVNGNKVKVTARWRDAVVHMDVLDPANAAQRQRFVKGLSAKLPQADGQEVEAHLLRIAGALSTPATATQADGPVELDIARIVRPEQVITREVTALTIPVVIAAGGRPAPQWKLYCRWAGGGREVRDLTGSIDLPGKSKLWIHPIPAEPSLSVVSGWSAASRKAWLAGAPAPDPAALFKRLCQRIAYFIDLPSDVAAGTVATLALWSLLTYTFQAWDAVPYLNVGGPLGSGKTRLFEILCRLVYRPLLSSSLTAPALFRTLHDRGGVLLFDEAERLRQSTPEVGELLSMLLAGYKRGGQATRLEAVGDSFRTVAFDVYGPKALAGIAGLPPALSSRCIQVLMFRAAPDSPKPRRRIDADPDGWQRLRDELHVLALEHGPTWVGLAQRADVCPNGIDGRNYELWQPLLALAWWVESHGADGLLKLMQRHALASVNAGGEDQVPDADETLLEILAAGVQAGEWLSAGEMLSRAQERDPNTFGRPNGPGPRWQPNGVTRRLKVYGIPAPRKSNGERRYRHVTLTTLWRIQRNYGIDLGIDNPSPAPQLPTLTAPADPGVPVAHA
jgi:hypothetical protein